MCQGLFKKTKISVVLLVIISLPMTYLPLGFLPPPSAAEENPAIWMTGWSYRQAITIDNTQNASSLTDYQVSVDPVRCLLSNGIDKVFGFAIIKLVNPPRAVFGPCGAFI